jgi:YHS domain-containing protein/ketosteroid isomerase-like protein
VSNSAQVVTEYLTAYASGDVDRTMSLVTDDFALRMPSQQVAGADARDEIAALVAHIAPYARGYQMIRQWEDGDEISSFYELKLEAPGGLVSMPISQWDTVRSGKLRSSFMVFDTTVFQTGREGALGAHEAIDPVCHMRVEPSSAQARRDHAGATYYFCSLGCADRFESHPERYIGRRGLTP